MQGLEAAQESNAQFQAAWWKQFNDPTLDALIQRAAANNLDLRIAVARLHDGTVTPPASALMCFAVVGYGLWWRLVWCRRKRLEAGE